MEFRPCIDIHNGRVKQIVGGSLSDLRDTARENFVSEKGAAYYAAFYRERNIRGGHVILLNPADSVYYEDTRRQAYTAFAEYPEGLQAGGGIRPENAASFLEAGASHVIATSYVFSGGEINAVNLSRLRAEVGRERLVLDLSCRKRDRGYYIVTDRWQTFTDVQVNERLLEELARECAEFLVHGVDVEGRQQGVEEELVSLLGKFQGIPVTYAGGVASLEDLKKLRRLGRGRVNVTVGSALDLFGGPLSLEAVLRAVDS